MREVCNLFQDVRRAADPLSQTFDNSKSHKVWELAFFRLKIEELAICSCMSWQQKYKAEAVSGCFVSPLLYTHFALQNCFIRDACLGQAAGISCYIHLLTNDCDISVTSIFYKYLLPICIICQHRPGVKTEYYACLLRLMEFPLFMKKTSHLHISLVSTIASLRFCLSQACIL